MKLTIRQETSRDYKAVFNLIEKAFEGDQMSDHREQFLVERLRLSDAFIPELSIVAEFDGNIVGHVLITKLKINTETTSFDSLALAPISVLPEYQGIGIGSQLMVASHKRAKKMGYKSIVLLGHEHYYPKFGYKPADQFAISLPFDVPKENCMAVELIKNGLNGVGGMVEYPKAFYD